MDDTLKQVWAKVLGREPSEIEDELNFFEAGGDSVSAIKLASQASEKGLAISAQKVFRNPTYGAMKQDLESSHSDQETPKTNGGAEYSKGASGTQKDTNTSNHLATFKLVNACLQQCGLDGSLLEDFLPCTPFQRELIVASHNLDCWKFQAVFEVSRNAEARAQKAVDLVHQRNATFRTRIAQHDTELYQLVFKGTPEWRVIDDSVETACMKELAPRMTYGDQLSRLAVVRAEDKSFLVWTQSHAIYDRWSKMHVLEDIQAAFLDPGKFASSPLRTTFKHFVDQIEACDRQESMVYWKRQLEGLQEYKMIADVPPNQAFKTSETNSLRKITKYRKPKDTHITFATVTNVAWAMVLSNESKLDDIFFGAFRSCRQMDISGVDAVIGPLWSVVPFRTSLKTHHNLDDLLQHVHDSMIEGIPHEPYGIAAMDEHFGHKGYLQSMLLTQPPQPNSFSGTSKVRDDQTGEEMSLRSAGELWTQARAHFGLYIMLTPKDDDLELWARFDENFIDQDRVLKLLEKYAQMLDKVLDASWKDTTISSICEHITETSETNGAADGIDENPEDTDYEIEGVESDKPATLTYLLNKKSEDALACIVPGEKDLNFTYKDLAKHIQGFQKKLADLGIRHKSAVSMTLGNTYEIVVAFLATTHQRAIAAPLNPSYKQAEFEFYIDDLGSSLVLIPRGKFSDKEPAVAAARKYNAAIAEVYLNEDSSEVVLDVKDQGGLKDAKDKGKLLEAEENDIALVLHTSGTTGRPKAVPLNHKNLVTNITNICNTYRLRPKDRTMLIMPLFHVHGLLASFLSPLRSGGAAIIPQRLTPEFWSQFKEHGANWYSATPTMHKMILSFPVPDSGLPEIRFIRSCSSQLSPSLFDQLQKKFRAPVLESYAMTEASHMMTSNPLPPGKRYSGCVGQAQTLDLKLLDVDGNEVGQGKEGEVCIRGENVTKGYINNPEANKSSFTKDGFFRTGDQGKLDQEGYLTLTGRLKEMINKGGEKISPVELDNVINQHEDISECVSFGVEDEDYGQEVGCAIKLNDGKSDLDVKALRKWIGERISAHKVPKKIWFPTEIPKTATGKVQRKMVAEKMSNEEAV